MDRKVHLWAADLVDSRAFEATVITAIVTQAVVLGAQTYVSGRDGLFTALNGFLLMLFTVELLLRFLSCGGKVKDFARDRWNVFDAVVILLSWLPGAGTPILLLRIARLLRVSRLMRYLPDLRIAMSAVGKSAGGIAGMAGATSLLIFIYSMIGVELFGEANPESFGNVGRAMLTMFMLLSLENLPDIVSAGVDITPWAVPYFVSYAMVASFLLFNLFIGVVLNAMEEARGSERSNAESDDLLGRLRAAREALELAERELRGSRCTPCSPGWTGAVYVPHTCGSI